MENEKRLDLIDNLNIWHGCPQCLTKMDGGNEDDSKRMARKA